jgi:lysophospholipase L1-like esterase
MRPVGSFFLAVLARYPGIGRRFRAGVLCIGMIWLSGCGSLVAARSSTLLGISNPGYPHHADYLEYQQGRLTKAQLTDRLPHVAMIGDSLSRDFYVSSIVSMIWRSKMHHRCNWFLDTDPSANSAYSLYERLAQETPLAACEYSSVGGWVDAGENRQRVLGSWFVFSFSQQVDLILAEIRFPDLVLIWIGHNNLRWTLSVDPHRPEEIETGLQKMAVLFRENYKRQLGRLVERAREQKERRAIIVFGLVDMNSFFEARDAAEQLRKKNPKLYPYFDVVLQRFESTKPEYRANMAKLALMYNEELRAMVGDFNRELGGDSPMRLEYSDALAAIDFSDVEVLQPIDAWHPSAKAHNLLAEAAFGALRPSLDFLEIVPLQKNADLR